MTPQTAGCQPPEMSPGGSSTALQDPPSRDVLTPTDTLGLRPLGRWGRLLVAVGIAGLYWGWEPWAVYKVGCDEAHMLQAAVRLARGQGLTNTWDYRLDDLATPTYQVSHAWPPLYSWLVAGWLKAGWDFASVGDLLRCGKLVATAAGAYAWLGLACRLLPPGGVWMMAVMLGGLVYIPERGFVYGPSHLYLWAILPGMIHALLDALTGDGSPHDPQGRRAAIRAVHIAGWWAALGMAIRYQVDIPVAGVAAVMLLWPGSWYQRVRAAGAFVWPAALVMGAFALYMRVGHGATPWVDALPSPGITWSNVRGPEPLTAWALFGFGLEEAIYKLKPSARHGQVPWVGAILVPWYALLIALGAWGWVRGWPRFTPPQRVVIVIAAVMALALSGLMVALTVRVDPAGGWFPHEEHRYYTGLAPVAALVWLLALGSVIDARLGSWPRRPQGWLALGVCVGIVALSVRGLVQAGRLSWREVRVIRDDGIRTDSQLVSQLRTWVAGHQAAGRRVRVFDSWDGAVARLVADDGVPALKTEDPAHLARLACRYPVEVCVVARWRHNPRTGQTQPTESTAKALATAAFLDLASTGTTVWDRGELCTLYTGTVNPFEAGHRSVPHLPLLPSNGPDAPVMSVRD